MVIFLTVFIDLIGFGIVLPLLPRYIERFGARGMTIGAVIASFSVMQFLFAPAWGRLSDRIGRRPVLLISNAGSAISYAFFALAGMSSIPPSMGLGLLLVSRVFGGACGANISVASAYIADITPPDKRSKGMGIIGVSFGLGFILGPVLGALSASYFGLAGPGCVAASLCAANFVLGCFILVESRKPGTENYTPRPKLAQWGHTLRHPKLGLLIGIHFLATFCFAAFESTLPLMLSSPGFHPDDFAQPQALASKLVAAADPISSRLNGALSPEFKAKLSSAQSESPAALRRAFFHEFNRAITSTNLFPEEPNAPWQAYLASGKGNGGLASKGADAHRHRNRLVLEGAYPAEIRKQAVFYDERQVGYLFAFCGLVSAFIQGGVIGRLSKKFGDQNLIFSSLAVVAVSMALLPYMEGLTGLLIALALFSGASGVNRAPTLGLISVHAPPEELGATLGVAQSAATLARIVGPIFATGLYAVYPHSPYLTGAAIAAVSALFAWKTLCGKGADAAWAVTS